MLARPRLARSVPFWILLAGSLASVGVGAWLVVDKISIMNSALLEGTATGVEVYGGQSWVALGAVLVGVGLVGLVATLFLGVLRSFLPAASVEAVESIDWATEDADLETDASSAAPLGDEPALRYDAAPGDDTDLDDASRSAGALPTR